MAGAATNVARRRRVIARPGSRVKAALCLYVLLASTWSSEALAQGLYFDRPLPLLIEQPTTELFLSAELDDSGQETGESTRQQGRLRRELKLNIYTRGFVYHPDLVTYSLRLRPEFRWEDTETEASKSSGASKFLGYSIQSTWMREKPYTVNLSAERFRSEFSSLLAADTLNESTRYSASLRIKSRLLPTSISYQTSDEDASGYYASQTSDDRWQLFSMHNVENSRTELNVEHRNFNRSIGDSSNSSERIRARLGNRYRLDDGDYINSSIAFFEAGQQNQNSRRLTVGSQVGLNHRHNLKSDYSATYSRREDDDRFGRSGRFSASLRHQLYENLSTSVAANVNRSDSDAGEESSYGASLNVSYSRRIPWGQYRIYGSRQRATRDDRREATLVSATDGVYEFEGITTSIVLNDINIDADSIIVTDNTGLAVYVPGIDYEVEVLGRTTIITRSSFGGIADDEAVLVDYLYTPDPPAKTIRDSGGAGVSLSLWGHLTVSYNENWFDETVIEGTPPEFPLDSESRRWDVRLELGPSITALQLSELLSERTPREIRSVTETLQFRPGKAVSLILGAAYVRTELKDTGEISEGFGINAGISWGLGRWGRLKADVFARESESSLRRQEQKGINVEYLWRFGAWSSLIRMRAQERVNEFEDVTWDRQTVYLETKRRFN